MYIFATMMQVNKENKFPLPRIAVSDFLGIGTSLLCTLHCVVLPLFTSSLSILGVDILENPWLETATVVLSFGFGYASFKDMYKNQKARLPIILFAAGFVVLLGNQAIKGFEGIFVSIAAVFIITAHWLRIYSARKINIT